MQYGEAGFKFYFLIKGAADIIVSKCQTVYLTEEKYFEYLMKLKIYGENEFFHQTLSKNKQYLHLNKKAFNEFVFEALKKIKTVQDYGNLSEEYQSFFRDFALKANAADFIESQSTHLNYYNTYNKFYNHNTFNFANNSFNFDKEKENQIKNEPKFYLNLNHNNKDIQDFLSPAAPKSPKDSDFVRLRNKENPEKNIFDFSINNSSSNFLNENSTKNKKQIITTNKASNISLHTSCKNSSNNNYNSSSSKSMLDSNHISSFEKDKQESSSEKSKLINLIQFDDYERKKSIIHFQGILETHAKAVVASAEKKKRKESYLYNAPQK